MKLKLRNVFSLLLLVVSVSVFSQKSVWKKVNLENRSSLNSLKKGEYNTFSLDIEDFKKQFSNVSKRGQQAQGVKMSFPNVNGNLEEFTVYEAPVLSDEIAALYPNIKTYVGYSKENNGARIRFSVTPQGVQTMTSYTDKKSTFLVPLAKGNNTEYIVYNREAKEDNSLKDFNCSTLEDISGAKERSNQVSRDADDQILRTFRIAISVNGEYTNFWGDDDDTNGTNQEDALAQVVSTLNRNNEVFEVDMAVTFTLVNGVQYDGQDLIFADSATDPYTGSFNAQLQSTLTSVVGEANYDIGHLFVYAGSTNGNAGCIGCVCVDGSKGSGFSQHPFTDNDGGPFMSDFFDIDYVPHEIGHQMGANHTFSHSTEGAGVNVEPGSGTTIMGYAGIVSGSNVQNHSDPYFNYNSIRQILDNLTTRTCWTSTDIVNNPPVADAGLDYTIPQGTAYVLRGAATDADNGDNLTYCWEQNDNGQVLASQFGPTRTIGGQVRSLYPSSSTDRYIPKLSRVIAGQLTETNPTTDGDWETVSTVSRDLNFALTVRDTEPTATGLNGQSSFDLMKVTVDASAGPFAVTSQTTNETWDVGSNQTITWDVAGTNAGAVNTPTVNIKMSVDGGVTFPFTLATDVPNDGSHDISVPATGGDTSQARIMVEGNNNIFFAVNSFNFSTQESEFALSFDDTSAETCYPADATYNFTYNTFLGFAGTTTFSAVGLPTGAAISFSPATATADGTAVVATVSGVVNLPTGDYNFTIKGTSGSIEANSNVSLKVLTGSFSALNLTSPTNGTTGIGLTPALQWDADSNATSYDVELATDAGFATIIASENVTTNSYTASALTQATEYFWRVKPKNTCGEGNFSSTFSFTTETCNACTSAGNTTFATATTLVQFNTIDNATTKVDAGGVRQAYHDYTSISTTVNKGMSYDLTVNADTDGDYTTHTLVWIDWNQDCDFDDAGEEFDLGITDNNPDGPTDLSPLSITVPTDALDGNTTMRVSTRYNADPTACAASYDGEVEDYTVEVQSPAASVEDFNFGNLSLYPNPSNGEINLSFNVLDTENVSVKLFDIRGRKVGENNFKNVSPQFSERLSFDSISSGVYLLRILNGGKQSTKKIIIK